MTKFNLFQAAQEFGASRETLRKKLIALEFTGEPDGFTIQQICRAIYGDWDGERLRKITEEADLLAIEKKEKLGTLVDLEAFSKRLEAKAGSAKQFILDAGLAPEISDKLLNGLADLFTRCD